MGIYIPNMDMPKACWVCPQELSDAAECRRWEEYDGFYQDRHPKCPLIDIVRCKDCKYWHDHEWSSTCDKHIGNGFPSDYFCADGERRTDEHNTERD